MGENKDIPDYASRYHDLQIRWAHELVPGHWYQVWGRRGEAPILDQFTPVSGPFWAVAPEGVREVHIALAEAHDNYHEPSRVSAVSAIAVPLSQLGIQVAGEVAPQPSGNFVTHRVP